MSEGHRALIVEDDDEIAADLGELVRAIYPDVDLQFADNKNSALSLLDTTDYCFVLLDLRIKLTPSSLRGTVEAGISVLAEIRRKSSDYAGQGFRLPVIVVTGSLSERDSAVGIMRDGASDVIAKPFGTDAADRIRTCMMRGGRTDHGGCSPERSIQRPTMTSTRTKIEIPPAEPGQAKTRVLVGTSVLTLPPSLLHALLQLVAARLQGRRLKTKSVGIAGRPHQVMNSLRERFRAAQVDDIIKTGDGHYWLRHDVEIGGLDLDTLAALEERKITEIVEEIRNIQR